MHSWIHALCKLVENGETVCLVTIANIRGSAPRDAGARMVVTSTTTIGTIGGGQLEYQCAQLAIERIRAVALTPATAQKNSVRTFPLGSNCGQCCGGVVEVLFETVSMEDVGWLDEMKRLQDLKQEFVVASSAKTGRAIIANGGISSFGLSEAHLKTAKMVVREMRQKAEDVRWSHSTNEPFLFERIAISDFNIAIFGAGHVGSATVAALAALDCRIRWIDSRINVLPATVPANVFTIETDSPAREVAAVPPGSYFLIMTHSHALDLDICDQVLRRQDARYCGLIGSLSKRRRFERLMRKQGMVEDLLARLVCPIGIAGIPGKRPQDIAVAVAAELLQIRATFANSADSRPSVNVHAI